MKKITGEKKKEIEKKEIVFLSQKHPPTKRNLIVWEHWTKKMNCLKMMTVKSIWHNFLQIFVLTCRIYNNGGRFLLVRYGDTRPCQAVCKHHKGSIRVRRHYLGICYHANLCLGLKGKQSEMKMRKHCCH